MRNYQENKIRGLKGSKWLKSLKKGIFLYAITLLLNSFTSCQPLPAFCYTDEQIANAIYKAEGGTKTKYPYGIKSINTFGNKTLARKICLNTIKNNRIRFSQQKNVKDFVIFLGSRYCPPKAHKLNENWVKNVNYWLEQGSK